MNKDLLSWATVAADETEELIADEAEQYRNEKTGYLYPSREVSWLGWYEVEQVGPTLWQAVCLEHKTGVGCGVIETALTKATAMDKIERHIMRDGKKVHKSPKISTDGVIPF